MSSEGALSFVFGLRGVVSLRSRWRVVKDLDPAPCALALLLGLGDLNRKVCHGFANGCVCADCTDRENPREHSQPIKQPWEVAA